MSITEPVKLIPDIFLFEAKLTSKKKHSLNFTKSLGVKFCGLLKYVCLNKVNSFIITPVIVVLAKVAPYTLAKLKFVFVQDVLLKFTPSSVYFVIKKFVFVVFNPCLKNFLVSSLKFLDFKVHDIFAAVKLALSNLVIICLTSFPILYSYWLNSVFINKAPVKSAPVKLAPLNLAPVKSAPQKLAPCKNA